MAKKREPFAPLLCSYPDSRKINSVSEGAEAMYCRLIAKCDDKGNFDGDPMLLLCKLYALRWTNKTMDVKKVKRYRDELVTAALLTRYECDNVEYLNIVNCKKSLRKDMALSIEYPACPESAQVPLEKEAPVTVTEPGQQHHESVTEPLQERNGPVTETLHQSNPIQSNPIQSNPIQSNKDSPPCKEIIEAYNSTCTPAGLQVAHLTQSRRQQIATRWKEPVFRENYKAIFDKTAKSAYLCGRRSDWKASFSWLITNEENYTKVWEGNYDDNDGRSTAGSAKKQVSFGGETNVSGRTFEEGQDLEL